MVSGGARNFAPQGGRGWIIILAECDLLPKASAGLHQLFQLGVLSPQLHYSGQPATNAGNSLSWEQSYQVHACPLQGQADIMVSFLSFRRYHSKGLYLGSWGPKQWTQKWSLQPRFGGSWIEKAVGVMDRPFNGSQHLCHSQLNHQRNKNTQTTRQYFKINSYKKLSSCWDIYL